MRAKGKEQQQQWRWQNKSNNCSCLSLQQIHTGAHGVYAISVHFLPISCAFLRAVSCPLCFVLFCFILFVLAIAATCLLKTLMIPSRLMASLQMRRFLQEGPHPSASQSNLYLSPTKLDVQLKSQLPIELLNFRPLLSPPPTHTHPPGSNFNRSFEVLKFSRFIA